MCVIENTFHKLNIKYLSYQCLKFKSSCCVCFSKCVFAYMKINSLNAYENVTCPSYLFKTVQNIIDVSNLVIFKGSNFQSNLNSTNLNYTNLNYTNLNYTNLNCTSLNYTNLNSINLNYTNFNYTSLNSTNLHSTNLNYNKSNSNNLNSNNFNYNNLNSTNLNSNLNSTHLNSTNLNLKIIQIKYTVSLKCDTFLCKSIFLNSIESLNFANIILTITDINLILFLESVSLNYNLTFLDFYTNINAYLHFINITPKVTETKYFVTLKSTTFHCKSSFFVSYEHVTNVSYFINTVKNKSNLMYCKLLKCGKFKFQLFSSELNNNVYLCGIIKYCSPYYSPIFAFIIKSQTLNINLIVINNSTNGYNINYTFHICQVLNCNLYSIMQHEKCDNELSHKINVYNLSAYRLILKFILSTNFENASRTINNTHYEGSDIPFHIRYTFNICNNVIYYIPSDIFPRLKETIKFSQNYPSIYMYVVYRLLVYIQVFYIPIKAQNISKFCLTNGIINIKNGISSLCTKCLHPQIYNYTHIVNQCLIFTNICIYFNNGKDHAMSDTNVSNTNLHMWICCFYKYLFVSYAVSNIHTFIMQSVQIFAKYPNICESQYTCLDLKCNNDCFCRLLIPPKCPWFNDNFYVKYLILNVINKVYANDYVPVLCTKHIDIFGYIRCLVDLVRKELLVILMVFHLLNVISNLATKQYFIAKFCPNLHIAKYFWFVTFKFVIPRHFTPLVLNTVMTVLEKVSVSYNAFSCLTLNIWQPISNIKILMPLLNFSYFSNYYWAFNKTMKAINVNLVLQIRFVNTYMNYY